MNLDSGKGIVRFLKSVLIATFLIEGARSRSSLLSGFCPAICRCLKPSVSVFSIP